jgi:hypothetical protein
MPTVIVTLDDGTEIYSIGFSDGDWTTLLAPIVAQHHSTILVSDAVPGIPAVLAADGVTVVTPAIDPIPAVYRDITPNEALALRFDSLFQTLIRDALTIAQQSLAPLSAAALTSLNPIPTSINVAVVTTPPIKPLV